MLTCLAEKVDNEHEQLGNFIYLFFFLRQGI